MEHREPKLRCLGLITCLCQVMSEIPNKYIRVPKVTGPKLGFSGLTERQNPPHPKRTDHDIKENEVVGKKPEKNL